jgi:DNA-binding MarR family transcriptional regulator
MAATRTRRAKSARGPAAAVRRPVEVDLGMLPDLIGFMLRRAQIAVFQEIFRLFSEVDIRPAQFSVLVVIERNPGLTQSQVSAALGIKRTNFVALLDSLEQRGLAERQAAAGDRRSHALHLTDRGKAVMRRLRQLVDIQERRFVGRIGESGRRQLIELLHRLIDGRRVKKADGARKPRRPAAKPDGARQAKANRSLTSRGIG